MPIYKQQTMLGCKMLKKSLPDHQTINMVANKQWPIQGHSGLYKATVAYTRPLFVVTCRVCMHIMLLKMLH
jgi:hypothetical protein